MSACCGCVQAWQREDFEEKQSEFCGNLCHYGDWATLQDKHPNRRRCFCADFLIFFRAVWNTLSFRLIQSNCILLQHLQESAQTNKKWKKTNVMLLFSPLKFMHYLRTALRPNLSGCYDLFLSIKRKPSHKCAFTICTLCFVNTEISAVRVNFLFLF